MQEILDAIPFVARAGLKLEAVAPGHGTVRIPFDPGNFNHVGTIHAAALVLVAETAAGVAALSQPALQPYLLLAKGLQIRYRRPATASCVGVADISEETARDTAARVEAERKADLPVQVQVRADDGEVLAEVEVLFHFRRRGAA